MLYFQAVSEFLLVVAVIYSFSMRCGITFYWVVVTRICLITSCLPQVWVYRCMCKSVCVDVCYWTELNIHFPK